MNEKQWVESIKEFLSSAGLADSIKVDTSIKIPYANEITEYHSNFNSPEITTKPFETDLIIYEKNCNVIKPRIIIEAKLEITSDNIITYSNKAQHHKNVTPFLRYGIMLGNRKHHPLPGRLFRHGSAFDFMISFQKKELSETEKNAFIALIKSEITYSRQIEEMLFNNRRSDRKHYFIMQQKLHLVELNNE